MAQARKVCVFHARGNCTYGDDCRNLHQQQQVPSTQPQRGRAGFSGANQNCRYSKLEGGCTRRNCTFVHPVQKQEEVEEEEQEQEQEEEEEEEERGSPMDARIIIKETQRKYKRFYFLIDVSGSMSGGRIRNVINCIRQLLDSENLNTKIVVHSFNTRVNLIFKGTLEQLRDQNALARLESCDGGTSLYDAIARSTEKIGSRKPGENQKSDFKFLICLTDGEDNSSRNSLLDARNAVLNFVSFEDNYFYSITVDTPEVFHGFRSDRFSNFRTSTPQDVISAFQKIKEHIYQLITVQNHKLRNDRSLVHQKIITKEIQVDEQTLRMKFGSNWQQHLMKRDVDLSSKKCKMCNSEEEIKRFKCGHYLCAGCQELKACCSHFDVNVLEAKNTTKTEEIYQNKTVETITLSAKIKEKSYFKPKKY